MLPCKDMKMTHQEVSLNDKMVQSHARTPHCPLKFQSHLPSLSNPNKNLIKGSPKKHEFQVLEEFFSESLRKMANTSKTGRESKRCLVMLRLIIEKLQKGLSQFRRSDFDDNGFDKKVGAVTEVPKDVKEGHFAVFATDGGNAKRFVIELGYLANPEFLRLLEQAEEEFGFQQEGVLMIPCQPVELQIILRKENGGGGLFVKQT